ncbi:hypothetical protein Micbo1qcDRAFT_186376 [Microdochium bolleyi]|uniref:Tyrosinase copper-binding domain-containing protein n=1 Tax=Microdochium bolleyi TaxID=196109 RepID=A0A136ILZ0_9PEZI|nr:hypothetical protein Micbo1qcDRAFT_186376 [Microdochium bolleyi]
MAGCRNTIYRRWGTLTAQQRTNYVGAIQCLMRRPRRGIWNGAANLYDEIVWVHAQMNAEIHLSDIFLPWHRYYLYMFRELLRTECNFNGPHPWWKETNNQGNFPASDIFSAQWFGALPQRDGNGNGRCISNGCIARGENKGITNQVTVQNEEVCHGQQGNSFPQHSFCNERRNHALFHNGFGPTMSNSAISPADPIFFLHHSYVDWQWKRWQNVASWRWSTISGCADRRSPCTPLTRDTWLRSRGLFRDMRVGELLDSEGTTTCYTYDLLV